MRPLVVDDDRGLEGEGLDAALGGRARSHRVGQPQFAAQRLLDRIGDAIGAPLLVLVALEFARQRNGVERAPVGGGEYLRVDDIGAGHGAGAGDDRQQPGVVGRQHGQFGHVAAVVADGGGKRLFGILGRAHEIGVLDLVRQIDLEPIGCVVLGDIALQPIRRPILHRLAEFGLRHGDALGAVDFREAAGEHWLGLVIKGAQQLRLPAIPHAGTDRADIGGREDRQ